QVAFAPGTAATQLLHGRDEFRHPRTFLRLKCRGTDDTDVGKSLPIYCIGVGEKFLDRLFARCIAQEEKNRPSTLRNQLPRPASCLILGMSFVCFVAVGLEKSNRYFCKRQKIFFRTQFWKKNIAVTPQDSCKQAEHAGFFARHEIALYVARR